GTGTRLADIRAICLTHLDRDHFNPTWVETIVRNNIRVWCHQDRQSDLLQCVVRFTRDDEKTRAFAAQLEPFGATSFFPLTDLRAEPIRLAHDDAGSHGFVFERSDSRLGYATDLGHVPTSLLERFC